MNRIIVCKLGRLGELKKIIDCNVSQLLDEQPTDSGHDRHVTDTGHNKITDTGQRQLCVQQEQTENKIIRKNEKNDELDNSSSEPIGPPSILLRYLLRERNNPKPVVDPNVANCPRQSRIKDTEVKEPEARTGLQIKHEDQPNKDIPMDWGPAIRTSCLSEIDTPVSLNEDPFSFVTQTNLSNRSALNPPHKKNTDSAVINSQEELAFNPENQRATKMKAMNEDALNPDLTPAKMARMEEQVELTLPVVQHSWDDFQFSDYKFIELEDPAGKQDLEMFSYQPRLFENHKRSEKVGMSENHKLGIEDDLWKLILNTQPETKQDLGTEDLIENKNEPKKDPKWEACKNSDPIFLSPGIKRRILDLALGEMVSLVHPSLLTSQQTENENGELTPSSSILHPATFSNLTPTSIISPPTSIISPPTSIFNTPTSTAITVDGLTIFRCGKNNEIKPKNLRMSSSNSKDNSQQTSSNSTLQPVIIQSKSIQTSHPTLKRSAPSPILTLIRPNSTSTQTWVNSDPTMRLTTIKSNPKVLSLSGLSKPSSANQTNPYFNIIQTQPNLPFGSNVQSHNCRLVKVVQKSYCTTASNVQSPNCTRIDYVQSPPVVTVKKLKETDDTWNASSENNEVHGEKNTFDQSEFQEVSSSLIPVVGTPESEEELDETVSSYKIELLKDAIDNRPKGGGKLLGTGGGKLLRSEGVKLDELDELDGGGEKMMVYEDITSLCLPSLQSSSPDTLDPCSSTSHTVQGKEDVPKRFCLVCGDTASGFHYGVSSCEACKAFFKRTIQGNIDYSCPASGDCEINKRRRKACQACRYQKCIRKGMLKEGVRLDRVRGGRQKYRRLTEGTAYGEINSTRRVSLEDNYMLECLTNSEPDPISILDCEPCTKLDELRTAAVLADVYDRELVLTIGWAKQVPGFSELSLNDQMKMLQSSWTEVLTLTLVYRSLPKLGLLNFATDFSLTKADAEEVGLLQFFQKCMMIIEKLASLNLYREEYLILKSLVLVNSDCSIEMKDRVEGIKESVISSLQDCSSVLRCVDPSLAVNQLLLLLPSLREADNLLRIFWLKIRKEGRVQMNRLLVEMLES